MKYKLNNRDGIQNDVTFMFLSRLFEKHENNLRNELEDQTNSKIYSWITINILNNLYDQLYAQLFIPLNSYFSWWGYWGNCR